MQTVWIILYAVVGVGTAFGILFYFWTQFRFTFLLPPVEGAIVFAEKYRFVRNPGMSFANRAHLVLTEGNFAISICRMFYKYRPGTVTYFEYPISSLTEIAKINDPKFNVQVGVNLSQGPIQWTLALNDPDNFIRVASHYRDSKK